MDGRITRLYKQIRSKRSRGEFRRTEREEMLSTQLKWFHTKERAQIDLQKSYADGDAPPASRIVRCWIRAMYSLRQQWPL